MIFFKKYNIILLIQFLKYIYIYIYILTLPIHIDACLTASGCSLIACSTCLCIFLNDKWAGLLG
jgi:hypothetical protein